MNYTKIVVSSDIMLRKEY